MIEGNNEGQIVGGVDGCHVGEIVGIAVIGMRPLESRVGVFRVIDDFQSRSSEDSIVIRTFSDCSMLNKKEPFIATFADKTSPVIRIRVTATLGYGQIALFTRLGSKRA